MQTVFRVLPNSLLGSADAVDLQKCSTKTIVQNKSIRFRLNSKILFTRENCKIKRLEKKKKTYTDLAKYF